MKKLRESLQKRKILLNKTKQAVKTRDIDKLGKIIEDLIKQIYN